MTASSHQERLNKTTEIIASQDMLDDMLEAAVFAFAVDDAVPVVLLAEPVALVVADAVEVTVAGAV